MWIPTIVVWLSDILNDDTHNFGDWVESDLKLQITHVAAHESGEDENALEKSTFE